MKVKIPAFLDNKIHEGFQPVGILKTKWVNTAFYLHVGIKVWFFSVGIVAGLEPVK